MRLSDRERDLLAEQLKQHAAAGRLDAAELEVRVEAILRAQTRADAAATLADLPPLAAAPRTGPQRPRWGRGHGEVDSPAPDWQPTAERFRDPKTGRIMRVWVDSAGSRHYITDR